MSQEALKRVESIDPILDMEPFTVLLVISVRSSLQWMRRVSGLGSQVGTGKIEISKQPMKRYLLEKRHCSNSYQREGKRRSFRFYLMLL